jgi:hypothetical protein
MRQALRIAEAASPLYFGSMRLKKLLQALGVEMVAVKSRQGYLVIF